MDARETGRFWDENAETWTHLTRSGFDLFRDHVNTPAFLEMLPDVSGLSGLDIGCGEGHNTRLISRHGARMTALDISGVFMRHAVSEERKEPRGIRYLLASGTELPFPAETFDFAVATMSLMDMPEQDKAVAEAYRVIKPGGFLQFSITHPCFQTARWKYVYDAAGRVVAVECGDYFDSPRADIEQWTFSSLPPEIHRSVREFRIPVFRRTLSSWLNSLIEAGFTLEEFSEPRADEAVAQQHPSLAATRSFAFFLLIRCRK